MGGIWGEANTGRIRRVDWAFFIVYTLFETHQWRLVVFKLSNVKFSNKLIKKKNSVTFRVRVILN